MFANRGPDPGAKSKRDYKPHLRRLFQTRCAYCLTPDHRLGGLESMTVDRFHCEARYPDLHLTWSNLYYSCKVCNEHYKKDRPTVEEEAQGEGFVDVCAEDSDVHFRLTRERKSRAFCRVKGLTRVGRFTVGVLKFNERAFLRDFWLELDASEKAEKRRLRNLERNIKTAKTLVRQGNDTAEVHALLERTLAERQETGDRLAKIRSRRPFPTE